jgi:hypothetical protein
MKTPWSGLLQYGTAIATIIALSVGGIIMLSIVGVAVVIIKISVFIK